MLENQKCILVYGLGDYELKELQVSNHKLINITAEMAGMKLRDILSGLRFETVNKFLPQEKVVILNNFSDEEIYQMVKVIRVIVKNVILATVTPTSIEWNFSDLLQHLIEEREWYRKQQKGRV
ncbi:hypothetical protein CPJCM30710_15520 [Clostridium polyendosporum]|uniref:DUF3783 domain-containing protein n=1 Tax=Clostridium polyendosporum TaxID=69208 RepID=A0A919S056_9CLOT|nr:DUF3783 domain-containing protein [Clostridium polyendosporum]GIM28886.1 hypothetical protein CPJCM30710_15520 [Clostridium polyendosporum]